MSTLAIKQLPLELLTRALLGSAPYVVITDDYADAIRSVENYAAVVILENDNWSIGYNNALLETLPQGKWRLWARQDYVQAGNMQRAQIARRDAIAAQRRQVKFDLVTIFTKQGLQPHIAAMLVEGLTDDTAATTLATLQQG